jgi:hypothetical protein
MATPHKDILKTFDIQAIPTLDVCVLGALELFEESAPPMLPHFPEGKALVVGSGNAAVTARILAAHLPHAKASDESAYLDVLQKEIFSCVIIISASGAKHAVGIAKEAKERGLEAFLITHTSKPPAAEYLKPEHIFVFPKNREPYTYNTSTYLGIILALTKEDPRAIRAYVENEFARALPNNLSRFDSYFFTVPTRFRHIIPMLQTKFDELFGPMISCRAYTVEMAKHATTVVPSEKEFFLNIGDEPHTTQDEKKNLIALPSDADYGMVMAALYYFVGQVQKQNKPYFKENIETYCKKASEIFGQPIHPIVD